MVRKNLLLAHMMIYMMVNTHPSGYSVPTVRQQDSTGL